MKKLLILITSISFFAFNTQAGVIDKLELGIKGYAGYSDIGPNRNGLTTGFKLGFIYGTEASYNAFDNFYLVGQLLQANVGYIASGKKSGVSVKSDLDINYAQIPLLIRYKYPLAKFNLMAEIGTTFGILQTAYSTTTLSGTESPRLGTTSTFLTLPIDLTTGIGVEFPVGDKLAFNISTRFNHSYWNVLSDKKNSRGGYIYRTSSSGTYMVSKNRFLGLGIGLSYKFGGNKKAAEEVIEENVVEEENTEDEELTNETTDDEDFTEEVIEEEVFTEETTNSEEIEAPVEIPTIAPTTNEEVFKVQIMTSNRIFNLVDNIFKGLPKLNRYDHEGLFKYTTGKFDKYIDARTYMENTVKPIGFSDAFIVRFRNGVRVPMNQVFE